MNETLEVKGCLSCGEDHKEAQTKNVDEHGGYYTCPETNDTVGYTNCHEEGQEVKWPVAVANVTLYYAKHNEDGTYSVWIDGKAEDDAFIISADDFEANYAMAADTASLIESGAYQDFWDAMGLANDEGLLIKRDGSDELWGVAHNDEEKALARFDATGKLISYGYPAFKDMFAADWILVRLSERTQPVQNECYIEPA